MRYYINNYNVEIYAEGEEALLVVFYHKACNEVKAKRYAFDGKSLLEDLPTVSIDYVRTLSKAKYAWNVRMVQEKENLYPSAEPCPYDNTSDIIAWLTQWLP